MAKTAKTTQPQADQTDLRARVKARLIAELRAADPDCQIEDNATMGTNIDGWFKLDGVVDAVIAEVRR